MIRKNIDKLINHKNENVCDVKPVENTVEKIV